MRVQALAAVVAIAISASAQTSTGTGSATHRPTAHVPRQPLPADPKLKEGVAAVGTMPAASGTPAPLYTLKFIDLKIGDGELAKPSRPGQIMFYTVHYTGWTTDGTKFDSSVDRNEPFTFPVGLHRVIIGWDTGFEGMRIGGKRRLIVPYQLAYGEAGHPPVIPEKSDLIFDVEFLSQSDGPPQPAGTVARPESPAQQPGANPAGKPAERPEEHPE